MFTLENKEGNAKNGILRFFGEVTAQLEGTLDTLFYLRVNERVQTIRFLWGPNGTILEWDEDLATMNG